VWFWGNPSGRPPSPSSLEVRGLNNPLTARHCPPAPRGNMQYLMILLGQARYLQATVTAIMGKPAVCIFRLSLVNLARPISFIMVFMAP